MPQCGWSHNGGVSGEPVFEASITIGIKDKVASPIHEGHGNTLAAAPGCQVHKQRVVCIQLKEHGFVVGLGK